MQYETEQLKALALDKIRDKKLMFFADVAAYLGVSRQTLYSHGIDKMDEIKEELTNNKVRKKIKLRKQWEKSGNATLQISLMKLIATDEERKKLSQTYVDLTTDGDKLNNLDLSKFPEDLLEQIENELKNEDNNGG